MAIDTGVICHKFGQPVRASQLTRISQPEPAKKCKKASQLVPGSQGASARQLASPSQPPTKLNRSRSTCEHLLASRALALGEKYTPHCLARVVSKRLLADRLGWSIKMF